MMDTLVKLQEELKIDPPEDMDMIDDWILNVVSSKAETELLDMSYFAEYNSEAGFKIAVDGLHNTPNGIPFGVIMSLNPNEETKGGSNVNFATNIDWSSPN